MGAASASQQTVGAGVDPRMPPSDRCIVRHLLDRHSIERPDKVFVIFPDGSEWTYRELHQQIRSMAASLWHFGVRHGDRVLSWLPNSREALKVWLGLNYLGAVYVPININYRGRLLEHVISDSGASLLIAHETLVTRLSEITMANVASVAVVGGEVSVPPRGAQIFPFSDLDGSRVLTDDMLSPVFPWDTQTIIYTSGTTGPSKGVLSSYFHLFSSASAFSFLSEDDRAFVPTPLFHASGTGAVYRMLIRGASLAMIESFRTNRFWELVNKNQCTFAGLIGAMAAFLLKQPAAPGDAGNSLRNVTLVPIGEDTLPFGKRFGVNVYTTFNMTEVACPIFSEANPTQSGICGKVREGFSARVVDENDCEVATGKTGELVLRCEAPWSIFHGYVNNPAATAEAWRNGWFHTGDAFHVDEAGNYFFIDRLKDAIRRRGENISSFELESEISAHPDVAEAAAVAVASEFGEDEVMAVIAPVSGRAIDPAALLDFLEKRVARFMLPRYIRVVSELPKTPTHKVQKHMLRADGLTLDTWDRDAGRESRK